MINYGERLKEAYININNNKIDEAELILSDLYLEITSLDYKQEESLKTNLISCIGGLGEINMKKGDFLKALNYYEFGNNITSGKDFNILFNLGVVYINLGQEDKSSEVLDKAKEIEPNNPDLLRFLNETNGNDSENKNGKKIIKNFLEHRIEDDSINGGKRLYIVIYSICTFRCCFCVKGTNDYKFKFKGRDTNLIQIKKLLSEINLDEIKTITIGGSEPLTNINIDEILYYIDSLGKDIELHTSGSEKGKIQLMLNLKNLKQVILPIYGTNALVHDKIVGVNGAYNDLDEIKEKLLNNNIKIVFHKLLIKDNFLDTDYIDSKIFSLLHPRDKDLYIENAIKLTDLFLKILNKNDVNFILNLYKSEGVPICFIMSSYILKKDDINYLVKEVISLSGEIKEKNIIEDKFSYCVNPMKCKKCILYKYCTGYFKYYFDKFGDSEIDPIINK